MAVSNRIEQALIHYYNKNYDSCLLELCTAIDVTAKRKWPTEDKVGKRFRDFFHEYRHFIFFGAFGWAMVPMDDLSLSAAEATLAHILYKRVRTTSVHDGTVDAVLEVIDEGLMFADPKIGLGHGFIFALIMCVIGDPVNKDEKSDRPLESRTIGAIDLPLNNSWGQFEALSGWLYAQAKVKPTERPKWEFDAPAA